MQTLDKRIVRLGIELNGAVNFYEDLFISASGTKYGSGLMNETDIQITNLSREHRDWLMNELSPYNLNRSPKRLILEAGRASRGVQRIFVGDCISGEVSGPPDFTIKLKGRTGAFASGQTATVNKGPQAPLSDIAQTTADGLGLSLQFEADEKSVANYQWSGPAMKQVDRIGDVGDVDAFIDDDKLVVKKKGQPLLAGGIFISEETGMVGIPSLDIQGVTVKFLLDSAPVLGSSIEIQSKVFPAANGVYSIYKLDFAISNRDTPFYWTAKGSRPGVGY